MLVEQEENMQIELLTPLTAEFIPDENDWDDLEEDDGVWGRDSGRMPLDGADLVQYKDAIQKMVDEENTFGSVDEETYSFLAEACPEMMAQTHGDEGSLLPYFPGYKYENGKSTYRGEEVGEGGYVSAAPGKYGHVALLDLSSMPPHSAIAEVLFGVKFTRAFRDIVEGRVSIKHEAWDEVNHMLVGKLTPYIQKVIDGEMTAKDLANALKTAINSVYGLTSANFEIPFRDP